jgi:hypothetical protein
MPSKNKKTIKFHGQEVEDVALLYLQKMRDKPDVIAIEEFDAAKDPEICETVNIQVVSEFVTITFYKDEKVNSIVRRELIPVHRVEHIWIKDLQA